jgi:hypothetical protein
MPGTSNETTNGAAESARSGTRPTRTDRARFTSPKRREPRAAAQARARSSGNLEHADGAPRATPRQRRVPAPRRDGQRERKHDARRRLAQRIPPRQGRVELRIERDAAEMKPQRDPSGPSEFGSAHHVLLALPGLTLNRGAPPRLQRYRSSSSTSSHRTRAWQQRHRDR